MVALDPEIVATGPRNALDLRAALGLQGHAIGADAAPVFATRIGHVQRDDA